MPYKEQLALNHPTSRFNHTMTLENLSHSIIMLAYLQGSDDMYDLLTERASQLACRPSDAMMSSLWADVFEVTCKVAMGIKPKEEATVLAEKIFALGIINRTPQ